MPPGNQPKQVKYSYIPLNSIQPNTKVNIYGVVKFAKQPFKSKGTDYCMMLSIVDESLSGQDEKLKCLLFAPQENKLPPAQVGDVIRFHRLNISRFAGDLQGQSCPGYSWVLFSGDPGGTLEPKAKSSQSITLPDEETQKIEDLRSWASGHGLTKTYSRFKNIAAGCYFDTICQVVSTCLVEEEVCLLLKVWDGTQTIYPVRQIDTSGEGCQEMVSDTSLLAKAEGFVYDLCLFDDHVKTGSKIKPGDFIELCNLHAAVFKTPAATDLETVELVLHRGSSFGRGVMILEANANIPELNKVKKELDRICAQYDSQQSLNDSELVRAAEDAHGNNTKTGHNMVDSVRPSTSKEGNMQSDSSSESVQITDSEGVQSSGIESSFKETSDKRMLTESSSGESVQIIESYQSSETVPVSKKKTANRTQRESSSDESVKIIESVQTSKESCLKRKHADNRSRESVQISDNYQNTVSANSDKSKRLGQELQISAAQNPGTIESDSNSTEQPGSLQRCMLKTSTIILNHPHMQRTSILDVLKHTVPYKFKVRARVYDYHPKPTSVDQFLQLYCHVCQYLCSMPGLDSTDNNSQDDSHLQFGSTFKGVPHYNCPRCLSQKDSLQELDSPPHLSYIYMMRLILQDDSGCLLANIWKSDAETFFRDITPEELILNKRQLKLIQDCLHQICPDNVELEEKPWVECCIRTYSWREGTGFQIFDTVVA